MLDAIDLFAGPGGWDLAARDLGLDVLGIEWDAAAVATRRAAGLPTVHGDVREYGPADFPARGFIASPPCQTFSAAGKGAGRAALDVVLSAAELMAARVPLAADDFSDERTALVLEPLRWALEAIDAGAPFEWLAFEQVPTVLPVWKAYAEILRGEGYSVATGRLHSEQYGVPETRKRAILVARLHGEARLPEPTHSRYHSRSPERVDPGVGRWISMAEALSVDGETWTPTPAVPGDTTWTLRRPSPTIVGSFRPDVVAAPGYRKPGDPPRQKTPGSVRVTPTEAAVIQSFPRDYPWQGTRSKIYQQIGNAVPPLMGKAVLAAVTGRTYDAPPGGAEIPESVWGLRNNNTENAAFRRLDQPAPTLYFGARSNYCAWEPVP